MCQLADMEFWDLPKLRHHKAVGVIGPMTQADVPLTPQLSSDSQQKKLCTLLRTLLYSVEKQPKVLLTIFITEPTFLITSSRPAAIHKGQ